MPELPEVETVRRDLEARAIGRTVVSCAVAPDAARLVQLVPPAEFCRQLIGRRIEGLRRRGKYLIVDLDDGRAWVIHRRMSGNILWRTAGDPPDDYTRAVFALDDGHELRWTDLRKFGTMWLVEDATMVMEALGPEPLDAAFTPEVLRTRAGRRRAPIKAVLLDQSVLAGMGNVYTDEALHYAGIHPLRPADRLKRDDWARLHAGIVRALRMGIDARGSSLGTTLRDHINVDGAPGQNQETVQAYGREGEPCFACGTPMRRIKVGGRSSVFCPKCQPAPRARRAAGGKRRPARTTRKPRLHARSAVG
ncbi:MAG TPA: bifunctional DNA-formamidopyrimidine glycosylase/DNA-(apurinic or apyrimidinic site) lyase [Dehalococcoidia bacterium]|nr:bifunctional DNA-formamidopyrimidine glycosylase/DNA-(apurinic or apyrimidinic site) lyase [Dehalococcoidia bacterium]